MRKVSHDKDVIFDPRCSMSRKTGQNHHARLSQTKRNNTLDNMLYAMILLAVEPKSVA